MRLSFKGWALMALLLGAIAISSTHGLNGDKSDSILLEDIGSEDQEGFDYDQYEDIGEAELSSSHRPQHPPPPASLPPPPHSSPPSHQSYAPPPPPPPPHPPQQYQQAVKPSSYAIPQVVESYFVQSEPIVQQIPIYQQQQIVTNYTQMYQAPQTVSNYSAQPAVTYQQAPFVTNYVAQSTPAVSSYPAQVVTQTYQQTPIASNYVAQPAPTYQPAPQISNYATPTQAQTYQPTATISNYTSKTAPVVTQTYQSAPVVYNYTQAPVQMVTNYSAPKYVATQSLAKTTNYVIHLGNYSQFQQYSPADLLPFVVPYGYRSNSESFIYYRAAPYRMCPKYHSNGPSPKDIDMAFASAREILYIARGRDVTYMNVSHPSYMARTQIFNLLSQQNARMDEEGLLIELVSQILAERGCMTKWEKQRYLPSLTKFVSVSNFPGTHSCSNYYQNQWQGSLKYCVQSKYRTYDGFCNNPKHPYWGKSNVCHIRLLSPDYADGISVPRESYHLKVPLPNPRIVSNLIHNDIPIEGPYNMMKMQWGQFINHDITNTALSSYDGLVDCCKHPEVRGCWPIYVPPGDRFYGAFNVTCLNFIRSGICPLCQLGPRQQLNKNTAFMDLSHVYGNTPEQAKQLRAHQGGKLKVAIAKNGEHLLPFSSGQDQCSGTCFVAGDSRVNQHPTLTALHTLLLRNHNNHAHQLALRHHDWNDETIFQEARRINIAEYQMITYNEYLPIVFGPILSAYYHLIPQKTGYTNYDWNVDPTTWNEYSTASCRFGHSQIDSTFGLYSQIMSYGHKDPRQSTFRLKDWFMRPSFLNDGFLNMLINGLLGRASQAVDPWVTHDVRNHLYQSHKEVTGGDLPATNIWRGRDHGIPSYIHYVDYCFNIKIRNWRDLSLFIPNYTLNQLRKLYKVVENIDLFAGGLSERHFPGADTGPTFACINGIQYYHLKFGDRYYFEHGGQAGSFNPIQLDEIRRTSLARLLCKTTNLPVVPQYAFLQPSPYNPLVNCSALPSIDYNKF